MDGAGATAVNKATEAAQAALLMAMDISELATVHDKADR
jgi:hypothetical protein